MATCPNCKSKLQTRSQLLFYHEITCPVCASKLEITRRTRIIGIATWIPFFSLTFLPNYFLPVGVMNYFYLLIIGAIVSFLLFAVAFTKFATFKLVSEPPSKNSTLRTKFCPKCGQASTQGEIYCKNCGAKL